MRKVLETGTLNVRESSNTREEIRAALQGMKNGEAIDPNEIPAEAWKSLGQDKTGLVMDLVWKVYDHEEVPEAWQESVIVPVYKEKSDIQDLRNDQGIKLIYHTQ